MSDPFLGQTIMVGFNFAPRNWALCNGQLMSIAQNNALFALLGTNYGGDGVTTFALPDFRGRAPIQFGQGLGLSPYQLGQAAGTTTHTLITNEMPAHTHVPNAVKSANQTTPNGFLWGGDSTGTTALYTNSDPDTTLSPQAITTSGGSQPHENMMPFLAVNFCIALAGIFPSQS